MYIQFIHKYIFKISQEDVVPDLDDVNTSGGSAPVTSQPMPGQGKGAGMPVYAMPPPPSAPTNPFTSGATESTLLNTSEKAVYTPGINEIFKF